MDIEGELQNQKNKYEALEQTWMAANENFLKFQQMANRDLQLAKSLMTKSQLNTWESLRMRDEQCEAKRDSFPDYVNGTEGERTSAKRESSDGYKLVTVTDYERLKEKVATLSNRIEMFEEISVEKIKLENASLAEENEKLEAQVIQANELYEKKLREFNLVSEKMADLEEAVGDTINAHLADVMPDESAQRLGQIEREFRQLQSSTRHQLEQLRVVRKSKQEDIDRIAQENAFLSGAYRKNKEEIHQNIQTQLEESESQKDVISFLETMLVEERSAAECRYKQLLDDRANLEVAFSDLQNTASLAADEYRVNREMLQSKLESLQSYNDEIQAEAQERNDLATQYENLKHEFKASREEQMKTIQQLNNDIAQYES